MKLQLLDDCSNVIDLFFGCFIDDVVDCIICIILEFDGLEMLYINDIFFNCFYFFKIVCWVLCEFGEVVGLVFWLN